MFCRQCGTRVNDDDKFCVNCGLSIKEDSDILDNDTNLSNTKILNTQEFSYKRIKKKWVTFVLWIFFGWIGLHHIYKGDYFMGVFYIISNLVTPVILIATLGEALFLIIGIYIIFFIVDLVWILKLPDLYY
ncbi:TM2 domain-containing protein [[Clostridium] colinum]|uniref:TM2 domain-containing protein n=1 Tax=[Clostridium] colinum TaxID=36835 RepID=UPI002024E05C|nr:TM2 domain-containing protein [[Clostridium] colinum]